MDIAAIVREVTAQVEGVPSIHMDRVDLGDLSPASLARYIDHTILKQDASEDDVKRICREARNYLFASVCVNPCYVELVADSLQGSGVKVCSVVGFPLGASTPEATANEAADAVLRGAQEVDMVVNVGAIKSDDWKLVCRGIAGVVEAVAGRAIVKVILETCLLTDVEKVKACAVSKLAGAHFVKTSTGFSTGGATVEDVKLMREVVGPDMGVKASGGVRTYGDAVAMLKAGASRLGTSAGVTIVSG